MEVECSRERTEGRKPRLRMSKKGRAGKLGSKMVQNGGGSVPAHTGHRVRSGRQSQDFAALNVNKLRDELKRRGLPLNGKKAALISRLQEFELKMQSDSDFRERKRAGHADVNGDSKPPTATLKTAKLRMESQRDRATVVLWRRPLTTLYYFLLETLILTRDFFYKLWRHKRIVAIVVFTFLAVFVVYRVNGPHQKYVAVFRKELLWYVYWVGLGILSSVGLGTGLHTFLLYLGPHIAAVTLAAFECMSVDFPSPPYPEDIICPDTEGTSMSLWTIMGKVRVEAFMWGAGTAIGELPPYFMARAARLSGQMDEEEAELEELIQGRKAAAKMSFFDRAKLTVHDLVQRVGFIGILLCASIPNPLFDLAGITCGHFLVPFWTFFGATLIGKALIKMHIQKLFVIFVFSEHHVHQVVSLIKYIPHFGPKLQSPFKEYLEKQKAKMHIKPGTRVPSSTSWLSWLFEKLVLVMVVYFVISIINSMAQQYQKRQLKRQLAQVQQAPSDQKVAMD